MASAAIYNVPLDAGNMATGNRYQSYGHLQQPDYRSDYSQQVIAQPSNGKMWKGSALTKANNPWSHLYGIANKKVGTDPDKSFEEEIRALPDYYDGTSSALLAKILISQMTSTRSFWLDEVCPLRKTDTSTTTVKSWSFKDEFLGQVPEEGVCRLVRNNQSERSATVSRKGLGFINEHMFLGTPMGEQGFWMQMEQINNACVDTASHEIATKIYIENEEPSQYRANGAGGITYLEYERTIQRNLDAWGILQKHTNGFQLAVSKARETMKKRVGQPGNLIIIPAGAEYATWEAQMTNMPFLKDVGVQTNGNWWKTHGDKMVLRESRAFRTYADMEDDPAYANRLIGDYVTMTMVNYHDCPENEFSLGKCMSIEWWSEAANDFEMLSFKNTIRYTGACPGWDDLPANCDFKQDNNVWVNNPFRGGVDSNMHESMDDLGFQSDYMDQAAHGGRNVVNKRTGWGAETIGNFPGDDEGAENDHSRLTTLLKNNPKKRYAPWMYEWFDKEGWTSLGDCYNKQGLLPLLVKCIDRLSDEDYLEFFQNYLYPNETVHQHSKQNRPFEEDDDDADIEEVKAPTTTPVQGAHSLDAYNGFETDLKDADIQKIERRIQLMITTYEGLIQKKQEDDEKKRTENPTSSPLQTRTLRSVTATNKDLILGLYKVAGASRTYDFWQPLHIVTNASSPVNIITKVLKVMELANIKSDVDYSEVTTNFLRLLTKNINEVVPLLTSEIEQNRFSIFIADALRDSSKISTDEELNEAAGEFNAALKAYQKLLTQDTNRARAKLNQRTTSKKSGIDAFGFYKTNINGQESIQTMHPLEYISQIVDKPGGGKGIRRLSSERFAQVLIERLDYKSYRPFKWIIDHNLPPCFGIISFRPNQEWEMGSLCLTMGGGEVGNMLYNMSDFQIQNDSIRKVMIANFTVYLGCLIVDPRKIVIIPDVYCRQYIGGFGTQPWDASDPEHIDQQTIDPTQRDVYHCIVNAMFKHEGYWMHLNGKAPKEVKDRRPGQPEYSYPTAEYYTKHVWLNWGNENASNLLTTAYPNQTNTLCFAGYQGNYNMRNPGRPLIKPARGPWGDTFYPGSASSRSGGTSVMLPVNYKRVSLVTMAA